MEAKRKKIVLRGLGMLLMISLMIGVSYAYWMITKEQTGINKIGSGCFNIELSNEKNDIKLENAYPITDNEGRKLVPYSFTITNTCDLFASYNVNLEMLEGTTLASKYIKVMVNNEEIKNLSTIETTNTVLNNSVEARKLTSGSLGAGDSEDYTVRIWMDGDITSSDKEAMNKVMLSKVVVDAQVSKYNPVDNGITLLKDAILANEYQTINVEEAKNRIANKQVVDFSKTAPIIDWEESHDSSLSTYTVTLPDPSLVGTGSLNRDDIFPLIGTGYTFNSETGYYTLINTQYIDPTTLKYSSQDYYFCGSGTNSSGTSLFIWHNSQCTQMHKLTSAIKNTGTITTLNGTKYNTVIYKMTKYDYSQIEIESDKSDKGLYSIEDTDGTSYYYRGSVNNNYVLFGGHYWRIIRINGDGSIRLLYAGTKKEAKGEELFTTLTDSSLGLTNAKKIAFNTKRDNPAYVGYMYGNTLNSSYEETTANEVDSDIKKYLDSWYKQNIEEKGYSKYIADSRFCNDRSLNSGNGYSIQDHTKYDSKIRYSSKSPSLICQNIKDIFTVSSFKGNSALTYPIGLITIDELILSGIVEGNLNRLVYSYANADYWIMSPDAFANWDIAANVFHFFGPGTVRSSWTSTGKGIRPVINLKADTEITSGIGTSSEPFQIK